MATMSAVRKIKAGEGLVIEDVEIPDPGPKEVVIKVEATSICGTDLQIYKGDGWIMDRMSPILPVTIGHEFCGRVAKAGPGARFNEGDYVSAEMHLVCGQCYQCRTGLAHVCDETKICGVDLNGCFTEYVKLPTSNVIALPENLPVEIGAFLDALGNAVHTTQAAGDLPGKFIAVLGCGPIGCMATAIADVSGAGRIYATDLSATRLEMAKTMGADLVFDLSKDGGNEAFHKTILEETNGIGVDLVFEMSGAPPAIKDALKIVRMGGKVILLGIGKPVDNLDLSTDVIMKGVTVKGVIGRRMYETWFEMLNLLGAGLTERLLPLVTHRFDLSDYQNAIDLLRQGEGLKAVMYPGGVPA